MLLREMINMIMAAMKVMVVLIRIIGCGDKDEEEDLVR
jgi:hypothetical protein